MTDSVNGPIYPTDWRTIDSLVPIDCRNLSDDTYQLRSPSHTITINAEGFELFRSGDSKAWNKWLDDNNIESVPRDDI